MAQPASANCRSWRKDFNAYWPLRNKATPKHCSAFLRWRIDDYRQMRETDRPECYQRPWPENSACGRMGGGSGNFRRLSASAFRHNRATCLAVSAFVQPAFAGQSVGLDLVQLSAAASLVSSPPCSPILPSGNFISPDIEMPNELSPPASGREAIIASPAEWLPFASV